MKIIFSLILLISIQTLQAQTFTSTNSGSFTDTGIWTPTPIGTDFTGGLATFIISDGHNITIDGGSNTTINNLEVGAGGAGGSLTFGDGTAATVNSLIINSALTIQTNSTIQVNTNDNNTHTLRVDGDIVNNGGTFDLENGTGLVNTTLINTATSVLSGSAMIFNDLTISGGSTVLLVAQLDINGALALSNSGTNITTTTNQTIAGDFTVSSSASFIATSSTIFFDGASAQNLDFTGSTSVEFNNLTFDNSIKTVVGEIKSDGTFEISDDAIWSNPAGNIHNIATFEVKNTIGVSVTSGQITFTGGEIRFGNDTNTDGTFTLGSETDIIIDGAVSIERDDQVTVDGDVEITTDGYLVINGLSSAIVAGQSDAELLVTGSRTLTIQDQGDLFMRGYDNFPVGFDTYVLRASSLLRYDADFDQIIMSENYNNNTIDMGQLYLSQPEASAQRTKQISTGDGNLNVTGNFQLINGVNFLATHAMTMTFGGYLYMDDGDIGSPIFNADAADVILDSDNTQLLDGPVDGSYIFGSLTITNSSIPEAIHYVYIDDNIFVEDAFTVTNPNGSEGNTLILDIDDNIIFGTGGSDETLTLGSNTIIYTSTDDEAGFAQNFDDVGDVITIDNTSTIRFDRNGNQIIPDFNGGVFGNIQFSGSGNKYVLRDLDINGDVTRVGGTPTFRYGTRLVGATELSTFIYSHTISGDWNMGTAYTHDNESTSGTGGPSNPTITFDGTDQVISSSDFHNIVFDGSGTKTITGTLLIDGDLTVNDGVTVEGGAEAIDIAGDWTENGTGTYIQTGSTTEFNGGATQSIIQNIGSNFFDLYATNSTTLTINSAVQIGDDLVIESGSSLGIEGQSLSVSGNLVINTGASITYTTPSTTTIILDGSSEQNFYNINNQSYPTLEFEGVGNKDLVSNNFTIEGDVLIASETTVNGNGYEIDFSGSNWTNNGNFQHSNSVNFINTSGITTVSTSTFHDIEIGTDDGATTASVLLGGNISLSGEMNIFANTTLDVSGSNYFITVEEDWNNYGVFEAQNGTVNFTGGESDFRTFSLTVANSGVQADKDFYNLTVNLTSGSRFDVEQEGVVLNDQIDVLNDLNIATGIFRLVEDDGDADPGPALLNIGGSLINSDGGFEFRQENAKIVMNGSSGSHSIDLGGDQVRDFEIDANGATYELTGDFIMRDDADNAFTMIDGTLDLNGNIMTVNRGGLDMTGGTVVVDEGASLLINDLAVDPDFNKSGGTLQIVGIDGTPATLSSVDVGGFTFTQSAGDIQAQYYTIASTSGEGLRIEGGTIDNGATGNNFSNGAFTSGIGTSYLTLANIAIGSQTAANVIFNSGPTNNVAVDGANLPAGGTIEFVIAGGSLAGAQDELDVPDGGALDGYILWAEDDGLVWNGSTSTSWNDAANWDDIADVDADNIPDADDIVYIEGSTPFDVVIVDGESFDASRLTVRNSGSLSFEGTAQLNIGGNLTVFSGATIDMTNSANSNLFVAGSWSNGGTFNEGSATVTFNGTEGTNPITTLGNGDPFCNLVIDGDGATYTLGSILTTTNSFTLSNGTFDASSGLDIYINKDWLVNGGIFNAGQGRVRFNGSSGTQSISGGTMWDVRFENAAIKSIDGNVLFGDDVNIVAGSGDVEANDRTIFVGGDWDLDQTNGFVPGTSTVIFNGTASQNLESDDTHDLSFHDIIFQNAGAKNFYYNNTISGDFSIISDNTFVDLETGSVLTIAGALNQTGGNFRIFDSNFPTAGSYNLSGGEVDFLQDVALSIPGGIEFNDLEIRALSDVATVATLGGDITVNDDINFSYGSVELDAAGHTITLGDYLYLSDNETLTWNGGTLHHVGDAWYMDADFNTTTRGFENLILGGSSLKRPYSNIAVNGNLTVLDGVELDQLTREITNDGDGIFTMEQNSILDCRVVGVAFPTNFLTYNIDPTSRVDLQATGNQTVFTNSGTLEYGGLRIFTNGTATLDENLIVQGDFDMNSTAVLQDANFDIIMNGASIDIQNYSPSAGTTLTFAGTQDQLIADNGGTAQQLELKNVIFGGSGTKTLTPNAGDEVTQISENLTINSGIIVTTARGLEFSGSNWTNNGTFNLTVTSRPFVFNGVVDCTIEPGTNDIASIIVSNATGTTVTIQTNGLNIGNGDFTMSADSHIDFSNLTHTMASINFNLDAASLWTLTNSTLDFDRTGTQYIPELNEANANITGIPSIVTSTSGTKYLTANIEVNDLTIGSNTDLDIDNTNNYQLTVNGNWDNQGGDFIPRDGEVVFNSDNTTAKTITTQGELFAAVTFQGTAVRTYSMQDDMQINGTTTGTCLTLASATLDLNGNILTLGNNDSGDPTAELNIISTNGTLEVDAGATLQFSTDDDGGDVANTEIGGNLDVQLGGILNIVGSITQSASVTRSSGNNRIDINIESGGEIGARYYNIQYLTDEGLEVEDGATINAINNFSDGSFSNLDTDAGDGTGGDDNIIAGNRYLNIESDATLTIANVAFNFDGSPTVGEHYNVTRSNAGGNVVMDFDNTSGPLGRNGAIYEEDGDVTAPADANGQLTWELPVDTQWLGATSTDWNDATNWDNGIPSIASNDREAVINLGNPFNPSVDLLAVNISALVINTGILKVINSSGLDIDGDVTLGDGTGGALIMDNSSTLNVEGSWTTSANALFDNGNGTVIFDADASKTISITPGDQSFHHLTLTHVTAAGRFNFITSDLEISGDLTIENSAIMTPGTSGYDYTVTGNIMATGGTFDTTVDGLIILDGAAQTLTDMTFDELTASGSGTKTTSGTTVINDVFEIETGITFSGGGPITFNNDVIISGVFNGVSSQTYTMLGDDWKAVANSYTGQGTVEFSATTGTQYITQLTAGSNPVIFDNLTFNGNSRITLGRIINSTQQDGNINMTGDLNVSNSINLLYVNDYLIDNTSGTGTFTLESGEYIHVTGADNFPSNFNTYALDDGSYTRYWGTIDQTIRGGVEYGNLDLRYTTTKTLGDNIDVDGYLYMRNCILDASTSNYSINLGGNWITNYGNDDGSFIARDGTITFDGDAAQNLSIGETGTQDFNDIVVNKSNGNVEVTTNNININGNLNVFNGTFDLNNLTASIAGNMNATGTGVFASSGAGLYYFNAVSGTPTIGTNNSTISGNIEINAPGRTYELVDALDILGSLTLRAGTLDVNSQTMSIGNFEDVVDIYGTLNVSTTSKPGGTLALGDDVQVVVQPGGSISIVGTSSQPATVTSNIDRDYLFSVTGTMGNEGTIAAKYYVIENTGIDGIFINNYGLIDVTNNFSDGIFQNGTSGGKFLRIENTQDFTGANQIENIVFDDNPGGGATSIYKASVGTGDIEIFNYSGEFSGEDFDEDPNELITWLSPPTVTWTGLVSNDWFNASNWDSNSVPTIAQNVIIAQSLNEPIISDNVSTAVANNVTLEVNAILKLETTDAADIDLQIDGDITFENSASLESTGSEDVVEIGGSWIRLATALFTSGTSQITFNSIDGIEALDAADNFYDLIINVTGSVNLSNSLQVSNDFDITNGTFNLSSYDVTLNGNLNSTGIINANSQDFYLIPNTTATRTINFNNSELYDLTIGEIAGNSAEYDLGGNLLVNHDFNLILGTLDPNGFDITLGDNDAIQDDINISGTLIIETDETLYLGDDAYVLIQNGADFRLSGTDISNVATMTIRSSGAYDFIVESGGAFEANNFAIENLDNEGLWLQSGATLSSLTNGTFGNGSNATQYLRLNNNFGTDLTASSIAFNSGPTYNVRRNGGETNNIILLDASGTFAGPAFELDDGVATTGLVQWTYTDPVTVWTGAVSSDWSVLGNWDNVVPTNANTVQIPNVTTQPVIDNISGDADASSISIELGASLTINDNRPLTVVNGFANSGTITIAGTGSIDVGDSWTNQGTFNAGNSTVTLSSDANTTLAGGSSFYNLIIDAAGTGAGVAYTSTSALNVTNNLTITDGEYRITDALHTTSIGGNFTIDDTDGVFTDNNSTLTFDGDTQDIGSTLETTNITLNNVIIAGTGTKTVEDQLDINGNLSIATGTALALASQNISFAGGSLDIDGSIDITGGSSTFTFDGSQIQVITGNSSTISFDNFIINNSASGNNDLQLNVDLSIEENADFVTGIVQSSGSNPMIFLSGATVSYDGSSEIVPTGLTSDENSYAVGPVVKIGTDDFVFPIGEGANLGRLAISDISGGAVTDEYSAEYFHAANSNRGDTKNGGIVLVSPVEYWDLVSLNGHTTYPKVTLFWDAQSLVNEPNNIVVTRHNGTSWDNEGQNTNSGSASIGTVTSNTVLDFSSFTLAGAVANALPVELLSFDAQVLKSEIVLNWVTASEVENDYFILERSKDGVLYKQIAKIDGNGTTNEQEEYKHYDDQPFFGTSYYRLSQVDFDGQIEIFDPISVNNDNWQKGIEMTLFPNPTTADNINIRLSTGDESSQISIQVLNVAGIMVHFENTTPVLGVSDYNIRSNSSLVQGVYQVIITQGANQITKRMIIK
ncbi:MAG: T9SS type A sorting domain-containing protein [Reichenbachiella sp.]